tara:strand:- start:504 stop:650 length:147 start_codon:yes stop_codon:yes gene_type:complete
MEEDFKEWINSDNVIKVGINTYIEQSSQYKRYYTLEQLKEYFIKEFCN